MGFVGIGVVVMSLSEGIGVGFAGIGVVVIELGGFLMSLYEGS